jgi:ubiquitin carboxyl-terminal hydrolase L5
MTRDLRITAKERGDKWSLENEERKRREWLQENALRQHNFLGFTAEILKGVIAMKMKEGGEEGYKKWVEEAKETTKKRIEQKKSAKGQLGNEMDLS